MSTETTKVEVADIDIDDILNVGASVMVPGQEPEKQPTVFTRNPTDISFLDKPPVDDPIDPTETTQPITKDELKDIIDPPATEDESEFEKKAPGRAKLEKNGLVELANKLIEKKIIAPFNDDKPLDKYSLQDFEELFEANNQENQKKAFEKVSEEFFSTLPREFQVAAEYISNGGTDLKGLFRSFAAVEESRQMDPADATDAKQIVRNYLSLTKFGNAEEIEEEINAWEDRGELESKAEKFKPKLDAAVEQQVAFRLKQQEQLNKQHADQRRMYMDNVYKVLEPGELSGMKLDKKTQNLLFSGLVQPNYPSISGKQTNLLGHLLEKYQFVEPNHSLIAEALWLLADPDGYKNQVTQTVKKEVVTDTVRQLKTAERSKLASGADNSDDDGNKKRVGIPRPNRSIFSRES